MMKPAKIVHYKGHRSWSSLAMLPPDSIKAVLVDEYLVSELGGIILASRATLDSEVPERDVLVPEDFLQRVKDAPGPEGVREVFQEVDS